MKAHTMQQLDALCFEIERDGLFTGSRRMGGSTPKSDWDYVVTVSQASHLFFRVGVEFKLKDLRAYASLFASYRYTTSTGKCINLIIVPANIDRRAWGFATRTTGNHQDGTLRKRVFGAKLLEYYEDMNADKSRVEEAREMWGDVLY